MASPKAAHYNTALTAALVTGTWADTNPGTTPNGSALTWGELVRKWGKHTGGDTALIHHLRDISLLYLSSFAHSTASSGFLAVPPPRQSQSAATDSQPSRSWESSPSTSAATSADSGTTSSFVHIPHPHIRRGKQSVDESAVSESTIRPRGSISRATYLSHSDLDGDDSEDQRAWADNRAWWTGTASESVDEVREGIKALEVLLQGKLSPAVTTSARFTLAYYLHALGSHEAALGIFESIDWTADNQSGVLEGDAAVLERIRAKCLQGLCYELCPSPNPALAIQSYISVITLVQSLDSFSLATPPYLGQSSGSAAPVDAYREVYRWISTALSRAAVLSARQPGPESAQSTVVILRTYHALCSSWPASFRPIQRQKLLILYLHALRSCPSPSYTPALLYPTALPSSTLSASQVWKSEVSQAIRVGKKFMSESTLFPRAGSVNSPVIIFTKLCVHLYALTPASSSLGPQVIDVLWWAMTLTFQSQSILRYLIRVLCDSGEYTDARRVFELYVGLVLKARQTVQPEISLQLQRRPADDEAAHPTEIKRQASQAAMDPEPSTMSESLKEQKAEHEADGDEEFVATLIAGSKVLCDEMKDAEEAWRYVCLAEDVIQVGAEGGDKVRMQSKVEEAKGIVRMMLARGVDPHSRAIYQSQAVNHLTISTSLTPSPSAYYHLAYCYASARQVPQATDAIRKSLEMDECNVEAWHLLGILLTAQGDWEGAAKACEAGVCVWGEGGDRSAFGLGSLTPPDAESVATFPSPMLLPTGAFSTLPPLPAPCPTRSTTVLQAIRLRMTLNAIIEKTRGCEAAMVKQQELFAFFSALCDGESRAVPSGGPSGEEALGGSYISVAEAGPAAPVVASPIPPTPRVGSRPASPSRAHPPDAAPASKQSERRRSMSLRQAHQRHLGPAGRAVSLRAADGPGLEKRGPSPVFVAGRSRAGSTASAAPTAIHSHYRSSRPAPLPPAAVSPSQADTRTKEEKRMLSDLWLASAATFRRWGKLEQCLVAIMEAEGLDPGNENVWAQLGMYHVVSGTSGVQQRTEAEEGWKRAEAGYVKALLMKPNFAPAIIGLSKIYLYSTLHDSAMGSQGADLAEGLLNQLTQSCGWDNSEAWFILGQVAQVQGRDERARECWEYALGLEQGRGIREWSVVKSWL